VIVFGVDKEKSEFYIAKKPKSSLISGKKALNGYFKPYRAFLNLIYFYSCHLDKKIYIMEVQSK
jgi:hypothetical protein